MDFSEFETARGGIWRICAVIAYATQYCLAATVTDVSRPGCARLPPPAVVEADPAEGIDGSGGSSG